MAIYSTCMHIYMQDTQPRKFVDAYSTARYIQLQDHTPARRFVDVCLCEHTTRMTVVTTSKQW